jgi:hypothetical protein
MDRSDIWIALTKLFQSLRLRVLGFKYRHSRFAGFFTSSRALLRRLISSLIPKRLLLPGLEKPRTKNSLRRYVEGFRKRMSTKRKVEYLLPVGIASSLFLIISFFTAPPVTGRILTKAPEPIPGLTVSFEGVDFGWISSEAAFYRLIDELGPQFAWFSRNSEYRSLFEFRSESSLDPEADTLGLVDSLEEYLLPRAPGYAVVVGDEPVAVLGTEEECRTVLNGLVRDFIPEGREGEIITGLSIRLVENPRIVPGIYMKEELLNTTDAVTLIKKGTLEEKL